MSVTINDNSAQVRALLAANKERALTAMGIEAAGSVKGYMATNQIRDTGTLMGSINYGLSGEDSVDVGTNVEYATFVHEGTYKMAGRPYITNGVSGAWSRIQKIAEQELKRGF